MFHKKTQTYLCPDTRRCFDENKLYVSRDMVSPMAMAHLVEHVRGKAVGCDAAEWTDLYPTPLMLERFLYKCQTLGTQVKLFNYTPRADLDAVLARFSVEHCGALVSPDP